MAVKEPEYNNPNYSRRSPISGGAGLGSRLERVWRLLEDGEWGSKQTLSEASGLDYETLDPIIQFLTNWEFVDVERSPELLVRRRASVESPMEVAKTLQALALSEDEPSNQRRVAERVACRVCGGRDLKFTDRNQVECTQCHETQWHTIQTNNERLKR